MSSETAGVEQKLADAIAKAQGSFYRLVLLAGPSGSGKTVLLRRVAESHGCPYLNINLHFSQRMLEIPRGRRSLQVNRVFHELVDENPGDLLAVDNLEVLFDPSLQVDPLRLLKAVSRNRTLIAAWNGTFHNGVLRYAEPDHPEDRSYRDTDISDVLILTLSPERTSSH